MFSIRALKRRDGFTLDVAIEVSTRGVVGAVRPLRLRQDDARQHRRRPARRRRSARRDRRRRARRLAQRHAPAGRAAAHRLRVPGRATVSASRCARQPALRGAPRARRRASAITLDFVVHLLGLEPLLQRRVQQLSGGERQRVALGRALLSQPRLLLLDEPLASLDTARREEVLPYFERLRDELSIPMIYVSHQFEEVLRLATHVGAARTRTRVDARLARRREPASRSARDRRTGGGGFGAAPAPSRLMAATSPASPQFASAPMCCTWLCATRARVQACVFSCSRAM